MRGQVFELEGKTIFTFGGASSHDIDGGILELDDPDYDKKREEFGSRKIAEVKTSDAKLFLIKLQQDGRGSSEAFLDQPFRWPWMMTLS